MTYTEEVLVQEERARILEFIDAMIQEENRAYEMSSTNEAIGICASIQTLKRLKEQINGI